MRLQKTQRLVASIAGLLAIGGFWAAVWGAQQFRFDQLVDYSTFVAGIAGPLWSAASVLLVYVAYLAQREQLDNQQAELKANADELAAQNFDRTIFALLDIRLRLIDGIQVRKSDSIMIDRDRRQHYDLYGRAAIAELRDRLMSSLRGGERAAKQAEERDGVSFDLHRALADAYQQYFALYRKFLSPLHSNATLVLRIIDSSHIARRHDYLEIFRAHMSQEEILLLAVHVWLSQVPDASRKFVGPLLNGADELISTFEYGGPMLAALGGHHRSAG